MTEHTSRETAVKLMPRSLAARFGATPRWMKKMLSLAWSEVTSPVRAAPWHALRAWSHGFKSQTYALYELARNDPGEYLSDYAQSIKTHDLNGPHKDLLHDKLGFFLLMEHFDVASPRVYAVIRSGQLCPIVGSGDAKLEDWFPAKLDEMASIVLKPISGFKGIGFIKLERSRTGFLVNDAPFTMVEFADLVSGLDGYLVTDHIKQADYAAKIYSRTTNTVRVLTLWDCERDEPFIAASAHRFGTSRSFPVDNWSAGRLGGISCEIDCDSGSLSAGAMMSRRGAVSRHACHPENGEKLEGLEVPRWRELRDSLLATAGCLRFMPDIAWDVAMTNDGFSVLEGNGPSGMYVYQVHRPLLSDPRTRLFYKTHGVI